MNKALHYLLAGCIVLMLGLYVYFGTQTGRNLAAESAAVDDDFLTGPWIVTVLSEAGEPLRQWHTLDRPAPKNGGFWFVDMATDAEIAVYGDFIVEEIVLPRPKSLNEDKQ